MTRFLSPWWTLLLSLCVLPVRPAARSDAAEPLDYLRVGKELLQRHGLGPVTLFLASPHGITPFHVDRYSTLLLQFQGRKQVSVFPAWDERVTPASSVEAFVVKRDQRPEWTPAAESLATRFDFGPGHVLHIPFVAGHHVQNGADAPSLSLSIIFNTAETSARWTLCTSIAVRGRS